VKDPTSKLRTATRREKSDVANKLISMFLHELSRKICREWGARVDSDDYGNLVRARFGNCCPYCLRPLTEGTTVVEHLDGMNRHRVGLHIPGNVVVSCRKCNGEKRRDDSMRLSPLAETGWEAFLSHDGMRCGPKCANCHYWESIWIDPSERGTRLRENIQRIKEFRAAFAMFDATMEPLLEKLPIILTKMYSDCQEFAANEIATMLAKF
jgi:hypothetical protein